MATAAMMAERVASRDGTAPTGAQGQGREGLAGLELPRSLAGLELPLTGQQQP